MGGDARKPIVKPHSGTPTRQRKVTNTEGHEPSLGSMPGSTRPDVWTAETMKSREVTKSHLRTGW